MDHITTPKVDNVRLLDRLNPPTPSTSGGSGAANAASRLAAASSRDGDAIGTLYLTTTHLIFVDSQRSKPETWVSLLHIESVEKLPLTTQGCPLSIKCKNFLSLSFIIPKERECHEMVISLTKLSKPRALQELYAFSYNDPTQVKGQGWDFFDLQAEYLRMEVPNDQWKMTELNFNYDWSPTYPRQLFVPASASNQVLVGSAAFRSKGRLPVLTYLHNDKMAAICRCSQPLSGFQKRSLEDEKLLQEILRANPASTFMYVVDTRPKINAMANRASGKGYESEDNYTDIKFKFSGVENIHVMRSSLQKLLEACELRQPTMSAFLAGVDASGWLKHIQAILKTSHFIASAVAVEHISVLVHCSDGWDRTAQTCALSQVMLDPYYRTIQGIQALIEKDWLSFGHKFNDRCGHLLGSGDAKEVSPVFTQFLDCLYQMQTQFPQAFEFNESFLLLLHDHVYSCQYGTFLGNSDKQRRDEYLSTRTYSLWGYIHAHRHSDALYNPLYKAEAVSKTGSNFLFPDTSSQAIKLWTGMYNRFDIGLHPLEPVGAIVGAVKDHVASLQDHAQHLRNRMTQIKTALNDKKRRARGGSGGSAVAASTAKTAFIGAASASSGKENNNASAKFRNQPSIDGPPVRLLSAVSLEDSNSSLSSSREEDFDGGGVSGVGAASAAAATGDWGPQKRPLAVGNGKTMATTPKNKAALVVCPLGGPLCDPSPSSAVNPPHPLDASHVSSSSSTSSPAADNNADNNDNEFLSFSSSDLANEIDSIAIDWRHFRHATGCPACGCSGLESRSDATSSSRHCWSCGDIFCPRCTGVATVLPGHASRRPAPVCKPCQRDFTFDI